LLHALPNPRQRKRTRRLADVFVQVIESGALRSLMWGRQRLLPEYVGRKVVKQLASKRFNAFRISGLAVRAGRLNGGQDNKAQANDESHTTHSKSPQKHAKTQNCE
jgi:hypothetical protein